MLTMLDYSFVVTLGLLMIGSAKSLVLDGEGDSARLNNLEVELNALQTNVNTLTSALSECGCKNVQKPIHPAFLATFAMSDGIRCSALQPIVFDDVKLNSGSAYNAIHGIFTAPVAGTYAFQTCLTSAPQTSFHVAIVQNTTSNEIGYLFNDPDAIWKKRSTSTVTHLNAGEEVWMICLSDSLLPGHLGHAWHGAGDYHSHFSGFLVSED